MSRRNHYSMNCTMIVRESRQLALRGLLDEQFVATATHEKLASLSVTIRISMRAPPIRVATRVKSGNVFLTGGQRSPSLPGRFTLKLLERRVVADHRLGRPGAGKPDVSYSQKHVL